MSQVCQTNRHQLPSRTAVVIMVSVQSSMQCVLVRINDLLDTFRLVLKHAQKRLYQKTTKLKHKRKQMKLSDI